MYSISFQNIYTNTQYMQILHDFDTYIVYLNTKYVNICNICIYLCFSIYNLIFEAINLK